MLSIEVAKVFMNEEVERVCGARYEHRAEREATPAWMATRSDHHRRADPFTRLEARAIWVAVSRSASRQASGQVRALLGQVSPSSIYQVDEVPTLINNSNVIGVDRLFLKPRFTLGAGGR